MADAGGIPTHVSVQPDDFDIGEEIERLARGNRDIGAVVSFTGLVREMTTDGEISAMELEHWPGMTEKALSDIAREATARWPLDGVRIIHRHGKLEPGDKIVLVLTASRHRAAAFEAAEFLMDYLKTRAPFWKKEHSARGGRWVDARECDDAAADRWSGQD
ncbi:molybdopterin synthase catalytic subunit MoaE [Limibaculum sp. M0105]|uniref:Molybdopterin synthase catalytic subunit n=1 Tax=Thermohalobaculum xanthum TaxID=2753746 RepID=A0A8J7SEN3_9RHOB|nr:molybdopterin synthase catalytic subunit MoaE [Thermohalobaculum xanthum]MBK0400772.1 molybdopterin synthase catalytic subunit MoaE [Thermohalobaculum xanthum]